jgi:hypothetical protein
VEDNQATIAASQQEEVIDHLSEMLKSYYVFPDIAEQICANLERHLQDGDYSGIHEPEFFAYALTTHLQEINHDEHLWVKWHPEPLPDENEALYLDQTWKEEQQYAARLDNYGFYKLERLPGNIGYFDIRKFEQVEWAGETAVAAMNFLTNTSALIIDLRECIGGDPEMVALVSSYLFGEGSVHLNSIYWHDEDRTQQYWTLPYVPGKRYGEKPVYVLVGKNTFSGAEEFAYNLQTRQRANLVGQTTGGGAHPGASYRLGLHFEAFIPVGKAINPVTNQNWQGSGVLPDVTVPPAQAFNVAYRLALKAVIASLGEPISGPFARLLQEAQSALEQLERD